MSEVVVESKECEECGARYERREEHSPSVWERRRYCSVECGRIAAKRERNAPLEQKRHGSRWGPIERELRVVRVGPNPRMVVCEYFELAQRRTCVVDVKKNVKWVRGMRFKLEEPVEEALYVRPWVYRGPAPKRKGVW